ILRREAPRLLAARTPEAATRTMRAAAAALDWMRRRDDAPANEWFAGTMDLDAPRAERPRRLDAALAAAGRDRGALEGVSAHDAEVLSRAHVRWALPGADDGSPSVRIDLLMDPRREALIQGLEVRTQEKA